jgi:hypothetical protein
MAVIIGGPGVPELMVTASVCTPVRCLGCRIINIGCETHNARARGARSPDQCCGFSCSPPRGNKSPFIIGIHSQNPVRHRGEPGHTQDTRTHGRYRGGSRGFEGQAQCERAWDFVTLGYMYDLALRSRSRFLSPCARFLTQARASSTRARRIHDISPDNTSMMLLLLLLLCMPMMLSSIVLEDDSNALIQDISYVPSSAILPFFSGFQTPVREPS